MAQSPTVIDLSKDDTNSHQAHLRKLITIDQDFAEDLGIEAVREIEKKWPDLKAERFASQDITDLSNALRTGNVLLEFRILRPFLVAWKDKIKNRDDISPEELTNLAASLCALNSRQLGPVEKQVQIDSTVADNAHKASEVDNGPYRLYTGGYYLDHFEQNWPSTLSDVFHYQQGWYLEEIDFEEGPEKCRNMWPDLRDEFIPSPEDLRRMAEDIWAAELRIEPRLQRGFIVYWMTAYDLRSGRPGEGAKRIRDMVLGQMGPENMVTHDDGCVTLLRMEDEENYNSEEDSDLEEEDREQAKRDRLVTEVRYPRNRPAPKKRKRASST